jgi:hypothetical protein
MEKDPNRAVPDMKALREAINKARLLGAHAGVGRVGTVPHDRSGRQAPPVAAPAALRRESPPAARWCCVDGVVANALRPGTLELAWRRPTPW